MPEFRRGILKVHFSTLLSALWFRSHAEEILMIMNRWEWKNAKEESVHFFNKGNDHCILRQASQ